MIDEMLRIIQESDLFKGGLLLTLFGIAGVWARNIPGWIFYRASRQVGYRLTLVSTDHTLWDLITRALVHDKHGCFLKTVHGPKGQVSLSRAFPRETQFRFIGKIPLLVTRQLVTDTGVTMSEPLEQLELFTLKPFKRRLSNYVEQQVRTYNERTSSEQKLMTLHGNYWAERLTRTVGFDQVHLSLSNHKSFFKDYRRFLNDREDYAKKGIDWRHAYLLKGVGGTGKTTLARAIAGDLGWPLYSLDLGDPELTTSELTRALCDIPKEAVLLLEDFDCAFDKTEERKMVSSVSFAQVLGLLCGILSGSDRITVITTNYADQLDEALKREGRVDLKLELGVMDGFSAQNMARRFGCPEEWETLVGQVPAVAQNYLIKLFDTRPVTVMGNGKEKQNDEKT